MILHIDGEAKHFDDKEIVKLKVLSKDEYEYLSNLKIPYQDGGPYWFRLYGLQEKIVEAFKKGKIKEVNHEPVCETAKKFYVQSDYVAGPGQAIKGHHDGKHYDSKSEYYRSLKASGHMVVEPGMTKEKRETRGDFDCSRELKAAYQEVKARHH